MLCQRVNLSYLRLLRLLRKGQCGRYTCSAAAVSVLHILRFSSFFWSNVAYHLSQAGICCMNLECCLKMGAPCLFPCCCIGCRPECDGCSVINAQCHCCCAVASAAVPCNDEVPVALSVAGLTVFPKFGCCIRQSEIMNRG